MNSQPPIVILGCSGIGSGSSMSKYDTPEKAQAYLDIFRKNGFTHLDTARGYSPGAPGTSEPLIGKTDFAKWATIDTKAKSFEPGTHTADKIADSVKTSLSELDVPKVNTYFLHSPDRQTPFEETCRAMNEAYEAGKFEKFGLSNFSADEVEEVYKVCKENSWVLPTVYQGQYNAIARRSEEDLLPTLRKYNIAYQVYSPSAAGMFSGKVNRESVKIEGGRWDEKLPVGKMYAGFYHKDELFDAAKKVQDAAAKAGISGHAVALRWVLHHSALKGELGDGMLISASSLPQLEENVKICKEGPLPDELVKVVNSVWESAKEHAPASHF